MEKFFEIPDIKIMKEVFSDFKHKLCNHKDPSVLNNKLKNCDIKILINELKNIKLALYDASIDLQKIFGMPLSHLQKNVYLLLIF